MKKRVACVLCIMFAGLWPATAHAMNAGEEEMDVFVMSEKDESCIQVAAGKLFAIRFHASPGTGYSWEFASAPDKKLLEFRGEKIEEPESGMLGGRVSVIWTFQALVAGVTEIFLKYVRPWEKEAPAAKVHVFKVQIL